MRKEGGWAIGLALSYSRYYFQTNHCKPHPVRGIKLLSKPCFYYLQTIIVSQRRTKNCWLYLKRLMKESRHLKYGGGCTIPLFQLSVWCKKLVAARHYAVIWKQLSISNDRNRVHWEVCGLLQDGACTNLFENFSEYSLKEDLSKIFLSTRLFPHWHKSAACYSHNLFGLHIPGRKEVFYLFKRFLPAFAAPGGGGRGAASFGTPTHRSSFC